MHDDKSASDYNLEGGSTLHLVRSALLGHVHLMVFVSADVVCTSSSLDIRMHRSDEVPCVSVFVTDIL